MQRKLSPTHTLIASKKLPDKSFWLPSEGGEKKPYDVPAVAQIWKRQARKVSKPRRKSQYFEFVSNPTMADFAVVRAGGSSGQVRPATADTSSGTHYFVKALIDPRIVQQAFRNVNWSGKVGGTGPKYINQPEFVQKVEREIKRLLR